MNHRILFIEDETAFAEKIATFLRTFNFSVLLGKTSTDGIRLCYEVHPHLVIISQSMHDIPGHLAAEKIKSYFPDHPAPILLMATGSEMRRLKLERKLESVDDVLVRPFDPMDLYSKISECLSREKSGPSENSVLQTPPSRTEPPVADKPKQQTPIPPKRKVSSKKDTSPKMSELSGNLERIPIPRLLHTLHRGQASGLLTLSDNIHEIRIGFQTGLPVKLISNYIRELALGRILIESGRITENERRAFWERAKKNQKRFGQTLLDQDILQRKELNQFLLRQSREKILWLFQDSWRSSQYQFLSDQILAEEAVPFKGDLGALILEGIRRHYTYQRILQFFKKKDRMTAQIRRNQNHMYNTARMGLSDREIRLLTSLNGNYSPSDLVAAFGGDEEKALGFLYSLLVMDILNLTVQKDVMTNGSGLRH